MHTPLACVTTQLLPLWSLLCYVCILTLLKAVCKTRQPHNEQQPRARPVLVAEALVAWEADLAATAVGQLRGSAWAELRHGRARGNLCLWLPRRHLGRAGHWHNLLQQGWVWCGMRGREGQHTGWWLEVPKHTGCASSTKQLPMRLERRAASTSYHFPSPGQA